MPSRKQVERGVRNRFLYNGLEPHVQPGTRSNSSNPRWLTLILSVFTMLTRQPPREVLTLGEEQGS